MLQAYDRRSLPAHQFYTEIFGYGLEDAFCQQTCFIRNLDGVDLLTGSRGNNLYTLSLKDIMASSPICLLFNASKTKSWLWHRRLSHLNFGAINHLARQGLVRGLLKLKFKKDHLCSACAMGKSKKKSHKPKSEDTNQEKLYLLHMAVAVVPSFSHGSLQQVNVQGRPNRGHGNNARGIGAAGYEAAQNIVKNTTSGQNVQGRLNRGHGNNARGIGAAGYEGAQNIVKNTTSGQARQIKCYNCNGGQHNVDDDVDEQLIQDLALNVDNVFQVIQIILWYLDSGCSKHITGDHSRLRNFVKNFIGTDIFKNDHFGAIMGCGDYVIGDSVIFKVYYVEGLGHNLFSVG
nr:integrase, catalytic region, zinc finger, CCHC-type, peptidase aspartic, catalytic [Tanacetum cinerariifolium]